jgi:alkylhydroperoxidase family enzyme
MTRIPPVTPDTATPQQLADYNELAKSHAVSNMKAALLHSPVALDAVLKWYDLFASVKPWLGQRLAILFCDAISRQNACELCATFMKREIVTWGEDPQTLTLDEREQAVVDFGRQLADDANRVSDALYARLSSHFSPAQIVELTVFGGLMIVNNLFNSVLRIPVDEVLDPYRIDPETYFTA